MAKIIEHKIITRPVRRQTFNVVREKILISSLAERLPEEGESQVYITHGGFSSIAFVIWIAEQTKINYLFASTLRIGIKQAQILDRLKKSGQLDDVTLLFGGAMKENCEHGREYRYLTRTHEIFADNNWKMYMSNNHSKVMLFDTADGKYVIETSSNLNENPRIEQFRVEKSAELFDFYKSFFEVVMSECKEIKRQTGAVLP